MPLKEVTALGVTVTVPCAVALLRINAWHVKQVTSMFSTWGSVWKSVQKDIMQVCFMKLKDSDVSLKFHAPINGWKKILEKLILKK